MTAIAAKMQVIEERSTERGDTSMGAADLHPRKHDQRRRTDDRCPRASMGPRTHIRGNGRDGAGALVWSGPLAKEISSLFTYTYGIYGDSRVGLPQALLLRLL
jgi:hypothetical protein